MPVNLKSLISKANDSTRKALEDAGGLCLANTHYNIELEHFLSKLFDQTDNDLHRIVKYFNLNPSRLKTELTRALEANRRGNASTPGFGLWPEKMFTSAWTLASLEFGAGQIRSGFCILALITDEDLRRIAYEIAPEFQLIDASKLLRKFNDVVEGSPETVSTLAAAQAAAAAGGQSGEPGAAKAAGAGKTPNLDQFTVNLTENARNGKVDTVLGRDFEIRQIVDILTRRRQNNPILTGEAGVGKTAVVEGFALRIVQGDVPPPLQNVEVRTLDMALLQAGAGVKGEFENRLKSLVEEVKRSPIPIILFIDEAHTMIGAGGAAGQNDAANILKPALARGELRTIAATTWSEYKKYFEKDPALARRFQVVKVEEPSDEQCMVMMRGITEFLEKHHKVRILDEGVAAAVKLSSRFIAGRQLPDKAVSVLDTACARLALSQSSTPAAIEDLKRQLADLDVQERILNREVNTGVDHTERLTNVADKKATAQKSLDEVNAKWEQASKLVKEIREIRAKLETPSAAVSGTEPRASASGPSQTPDSLRAHLADLTAQLDKLQGENPLLQVCVDSQIVGQVISGWTGIPLGKMVRDEIGTVLELDKHLSKRVIGQDYPLKLISQRIQTGRASLDDPGKPLGVFMLVGPSGVGKTETALALSDLLYGGEDKLISINMSEFQEPHTVSTLKGSPPGYVGYGEGGVLTEAVRRRPYSVVLLDEVEKAHPDVLELFYQVFDKGRMEDGEGREIDFKNTIIILTSNACTDQMAKLTSDPDTMPGPDALIKALKPELNKIFKPAFLGRMVVIPFYPIRDEILKQIIKLKLGRIQRRMMENHKIALQYDDAVIDEVAKRCTEVESGARNVDNILTNTLLPDISRQLLTSIAEGRKLSSVTVGIGADGGFQYS